MTENQKLKIEILKGFLLHSDPASIETCRRIYQFLTEDDTAAPAPAPAERLRDGVYYYLNDATAVPFDPAAEIPDKESVRGILVVQGEKSIIVAIEDYALSAKMPLLFGRMTDLKTITVDKAIADWDGFLNTEYLIAYDLYEGIHLKDDEEYIPSLGELLFLCCHYKAVSAALKLIGGKPFSTENSYWSSTNYDCTYNWGAILYSAKVGTFNKYQSECLLRLFIRQKQPSNVQPQ